MRPRSEDPKLIIRVINFELVQPICSAYRNVTDRQTDRRTTYDSNTALALRASRGKNVFSNYGRKQQRYIRDVDNKNKQTDRQETIEIAQQTQ